MKKNQILQKSPFKTIVIGIDFSEHSKIVVKQAQQLAQQMKAKIVIVYADFEYYWQPMAVGVYIPPPTADKIKKEIERFYRLKQSDSVLFEVMQGDVCDVVLKVADKFLEPLVIVGSQGGGTTSRFILGSNAEKIALQSKYPVWVHRGNKIVPFKKILVPTDLSKASGRTISKLKDWSQKLKMSMSYLYVTPEISPILKSPQYLEMKNLIQQDIKKSIDQFKNLNIANSLTTISSNDPPEKIAKFGKNYDVIAMSPNHRSGLLRKFGRITSRVMALSNGPVLVLKS